jgi:pimeloyl-ACP methyl ester carboxylesterase
MIVEASRGEIQVGVVEEYPGLGILGGRRTFVGHLLFELFDREDRPVDLVVQPAVDREWPVEAHCPERDAPRGITTGDSRRNRGRRAIEGRRSHSDCAARAALWSGRRRRGQDDARQRKGAIQVYHREDQERTAVIRHMLALSAPVLLAMSASPLGQPPGSSSADVFDRVEHGYAVSEGGVKIHYASLGEGPLVVMIHGFPDFWYTWRHQMAALADRFQVVAIDQRGYNLSDKPKGVENYDMRLLVGDVAAVIRHLGRDKATIVGHDWGGAVAWQFAMNLPQMTENLVILNLPHPNGLARELRSNPDQIKNSEYARNFQTKSAADPTVFFGRPMTAENLSAWVKDPTARKRYVEAFERSDFDAMLNFYKRNYPRGAGADAPAAPEPPKVKAPVLMFHGLADKALNANGLSGTWNWVDKDLTIVTVPGADHFVQQDAADLVSSTLRWWLTMRAGR